MDNDSTAPRSGYFHLGPPGEQYERGRLYSTVPYTP